MQRRLIGRKQRSWDMFHRNEGRHRADYAEEAIRGFKKKKEKKEKKIACNKIAPIPQPRLTLQN